MYVDLILTVRPGGAHGVFMEFNKFTQGESKPE